jgi:hypothetical protein
MPSSLPPFWLGGGFRGESLGSQSAQSLGPSWCIELLGAPIVERSEKGIVKPNNDLMAFASGAGRSGLLHLKIFHFSLASLGNPVLAQFR